MIRHFTNLLFFVFIQIISPFAVHSASNSEEYKTSDIIDGATLFAKLSEIDIPVLHFSLANNSEPDFDLIFPPDGCLGASITNNNYVEGSLTISRLGNPTYQSGKYIQKESGIRIKVRGNTSANWKGGKAAKPGYKIKLSKKDNLLDVWQDAPKSKDWVLIPAHNHNLNYLFGFELGRICGLGWQPRACFVNVVINDSYKGVYLLCEAVSGQKGRAEIDDSGYIIEDDPYWWKPEELYFKSPHIPDAYGWTFKEPDSDDFEETTIANIQWAVSILEDALYNNKTLDGIIDFQSFAAWVLAHDIMNTTDPAGSNIFMIKDSFNHFSPFTTPFRMGPLWDMDTAFLTQSDGFSPVHSHPLFYFCRLFSIAEFNQTYKELWNELKLNLVDVLIDNVEKQLLLNKGLDNARIFENSMTGKYFKTTRECVDDLSNWLAARVLTLETLINNNSGINEVMDNEGETPASYYKAGNEIKNSYNTNGLPLNKSNRGGGVIITSDGKKYLMPVK